MRHSRAGCRAISGMPSIVSRPHVEPAAFGLVSCTCDCLYFDVDVRVHSDTLYTCERTALQKLIGECISFAVGRPASSLRRRCRPLRAASVVASGDNDDPANGHNIESITQALDQLQTDATGVGADNSNGSDPTGEHSTRSEIVPLLKFALPTLCIAVTSPLLSLVDTSVVGLASEAQLAAMAPATALSDGVGYILTFIPTAVTNLAALHMARKHPRAAGPIHPLTYFSGINFRLSIPRVKHPHVTISGAPPLLRTLHGLITAAQYWSCCLCMRAIVHHSAVMPKMDRLWPQI